MQFYNREKEQQELLRIRKISYEQMSQMTLVVGTEVIKRILSDFNPIYTNDDLLALYTITGGVPK